MESGGADSESEKAAPAKEAVAARAIKVFDRLRLRNAFAEAFGHLGMEGEDAWRAAARIRVAFLPETDGSKSAAHDVTSGWWSDPDVRWLTGLHETADGWYFNQESYEQMLWWSALPELVKAETDPAAETLRLRKIAREIDAVLAAARAAGYRLKRKAKTPKAASEIAGDEREAETLTPVASASSTKT